MQCRGRRGAKEGPAPQVALARRRRGRYNRCCRTSEGKIELHSVSGRGRSCYRIQASHQHTKMPADRGPSSARRLRTVSGTKGMAGTQLARPAHSRRNKLTLSSLPTRTWTTAAGFRVWSNRAFTARSTPRRRRSICAAFCCPTPATCRKKTPRSTTRHNASKHHPALPLYTHGRGAAML